MEYGLLSNTSAQTKSQQCPFIVNQRASLQKKADYGTASPSSEVSPAVEVPKVRKLRLVPNSMVSNSTSTNVEVRTATVDDAVTSAKSKSAGKTQGGEKRKLEAASFTKPKDVGQPHLFEFVQDRFQRWSLCQGGDEWFLLDTFVRGLELKTESCTPLPSRQDNGQL